MLISVFTPTFNRGYILGKLYESLCIQNNQDFKWIIVDDGSTDDTKNIVNQFINEGKLIIDYFYQPNMGKMQAHNTGVLKCDTDYFICVDSDDYLVYNAIETIYQQLPATSEPHLSGIIFYRGNKVHEIIGTEFPSVIHSIKLRDLYYLGFKGDTSLVYKTNILKKYLFPQIPGEKFMPEDYIYSKIDNEYDMVISRNILIITHYLEDGYTNNTVKLLLKNPKSMSLYYIEKLQRSRNLKEIIQNTRLYLTFALLGNTKKKIISTKHKLLTIILFPIAYYSFLNKKKLKRKLLNDND